MLESLKKDVVAMAKRAQKEGLCKHLSGNLSARDPETGYVVITPTQVDRDLLTARDMVVLVGSEKTIQNMTMNNQFHQRFTGLTEKLVAVKKFVTEKEENS